MSYKELHERFVSGHNGTSLFEVSVQTTLPAAAILTRELLLLFLGLQNTSFGKKISLDFLLLIVPMVLGLTVWNNSATLLMVTLYMISGILLLTIYTKRLHAQKSLSVTKLMSVELSSKRPYITYYRAFINIGTAIAILAVDFPIFPRRFAKAETYGSGLMDAGVGCFVISNAVVSPEARGKSQAVRSVGGFALALLQSVKSVLPLLVLGSLRVLAVKVTGYPEHVTEYGVHWNFFFTLAAVKVLGTAVLSLCGSEYSTWLAVGVTVTYQGWLSLGGLSRYLQEGLDGVGGRQGVLDANREGLYSCLGYLAIYLAGVSLGRFIFSHRLFLRQWIRMLVVLVALSALAWLGQWAVDTVVETTSRRLANAAYVLWMVALNVHLLAVYLLGDLLVATWQIINTGTPSGSAGQELFSLPAAVNFNGLLYFLLANVLTGLVNMSVPTIYVSSLTALCTILAYMFTLCFATSVLYWKKVKTKVW